MGKVLEIIAGCVGTLSAVAVGGACLYQIKDENYEYALPLALVPIGLYALGLWFFNPKIKEVRVGDAHGNANHLPGLYREDFERSHREDGRAIKEIRSYPQDED